MFAARLRIEKSGIAPRDLVAAALPDPSRFYDILTYNAELSSFLGSTYPGQNWSYPPSVMVLGLPFGQMGYLAALTLAAASDAEPRRGWRGGGAAMGYRGSRGDGDSCRGTQR